MKKTLAALLLALASVALTAQAATKGTVTGSFAPGEKLTAPETTAPVTESRTFVRTVVPADGAATVEIPSTGTSSLLVWTIPSAARSGGGVSAMAAPSAEPRVTSRLSTPSGDVLEPGAERGGRGERGAAPLRRFPIDDFGGDELGLPVSSRQEVIHVGAAEAGSYTLDLSAADGTATTVVVAEPSSPLALRSWVGPLSRRSGEPVAVHAVLADGKVELPEATVLARLVPESGGALETLELFDDGAHGDGEASDGHYAASLASLPDVTGPWKVRIDAAGVNGRGRKFARTGSSGFVNEPELARVGAVTASFVDEGPEGLLRVVAHVEVRKAGAYRFDVLVGGNAAPDGSRTGLAWGESAEELPPGPAELVLDIPASQIAASEGPLHLDVRLLGLDTIGVAGRVTLEVAR